MKITDIKLGHASGGMVAVMGKVSTREGSFHYWAGIDTFEPVNNVIHRNIPDGATRSGRKISKHTECRINSGFGKAFVSACRKAIEADDRALVKAWKAEMRAIEVKRLEGAAVEARLGRMAKIAPGMYALIKDMDSAVAKALIDYVENGVRTDEEK